MKGKNIMKTFMIQRSSQRICRSRQISSWSSSAATKYNVFRNDPGVRYNICTPFARVVSNISLQKF